MDYLINFLLLGLLYFLYFYKRWKKATKQEFFLKTFMYLYIVMVLFVTIMPFHPPTGAMNRIILNEGNLTPFRDLRMHYNGAVRGIFLNILMMMPFGFMYPLVKKRGVLSTIIMSFLFSLAIEGSQLLSAWWGSPTSRIFDVTDLITNTFGGFVGYVGYLFFRPIRKVLNNRMQI
ncbi:VanZ family protein [Neobacillus niacini]|uniref:VanZ family protein n=1 Tax=Neobacillus niacini TaxID=86668 RepID=UPI0021CAEE03|nr:VanZ family protein [Neobacillus niacini]MCM3768717.1 VanZ family protein [Neobacillus niacini]